MKALAALVFSATLSLSALTACQDDDVGVPCQVPGMGTGTGTGTALRPIVVSNALDCRSRLCMRPATTDPEARPLCTQICDSDDDCPDSGTYCPHGERFVCQVIQGTGNLRCCKMCVCRAFLSAESAEDPTCANVEPVCPKL